VSATHAAVVVVADDGTSPVGSDEWNAGHVGIVDTDSQPTTDQTIRANAYARIAGMPLVIASGNAVVLASGALLEIAP
jgi:hypothetical protein